ncbi:MAG: proline iminopeptidase [Gammaproteobacteria bacterium BRH_c0]|nr:MAG: proline iminopeptidase [Gammaproteobacteria bacterium BRH_c0]
MRTLYPLIRPHATHTLAVDPPHQLYVEECGTAEGIPVIFVHGGPGGGCREADRSFFDPERYRIILFDQRGSGRSSPHASLENNHTQGLLADMEIIRQHLGIDRWLVFGGSWGSTLALLYAQAYPQQVLGLVLRGIFLCRDQDIRWFYQWGASQVFPDYWQDFLAPISADERGDMLQAYHRQLVSDNEIERMAAAKAWSIWEGRCATLQPQSAVANHFANPRFALALARIEAHFFVNQAFIRPNQIIEEALRLADIPGIVVHGRYDMVCPVDQAYALAQVWPGAELDIIRDAGHSSSEPGIVDALVRATDTMASRLRVR